MLELTVNRRIHSVVISAATKIGLPAKVHADARVDTPYSPRREFSMFEKIFATVYHHGAAKWLEEGDVRFCTWWRRPKIGKYSVLYTQQIIKKKEQKKEEEEEEEGRRRRGRRGRRGQGGEEEEKEGEGKEVKRREKWVRN